MHCTEDYSGVLSTESSDVSSDSGRLTILKETARSQEWIVLRATTAHQTMVFAKNCELSQTNWC